MTEERNNKKIIFNIILGLIVIVWSFLVLNEGFYMDECGLLSVYKGIFQGNRMFVDTWDELSFGAFFTYPWYALYFGFLEQYLYPLGCGFVLYMRIIYQIVRLFIAIYLYITIKRTRYRDSAFLTALVYYAFVISFKNFSYKSLCDFGIILFLCWLYRYMQTRNTIYFVLMGIATCVSILAYPTMIVFPFFVVISLIVLTVKGESFVNSIIIYSVTCFVCGLAVISYLQINVGFENIIPQLQYLSDTAYHHPWYVRIGLMASNYIAIFIIAYVPVVILKLVGKIRYIDNHMIQIILSVYWVLFMVAIIGLRPASVSTSRFIYGCLIVFAWYPFFIHKNKDAEYTVIGKYKIQEYSGDQMLKCILLVSLVIQLIWAVSTNQDISIPGHMSLYTVLAVVMIAEEDLSGLKLLRIAIVVTSLFFMGIWVAEDDGGYSDIFEQRYYVTEGAYKGIALSESDYNMNEACYDLLTEYVSEDDFLYVPMGFSVTGYLNSDALQGVGTPYARAGKGQNGVLNYWEVNTDRIPDYILIDTANKYYDELLEGDTYQYIIENYPTTVAAEGNFVLLSK